MFSYLCGVLLTIVWRKKGERTKKGRKDQKREKGPTEGRKDQKREKGPTEGRKDQKKGERTSKEGRKDQKKGVTQLLIFLVETLTAYYKVLYI